MRSFWPKTPFPGTVDTLFLKWLAYQNGVNLKWISKDADNKLLGIGDLVQYAKENDVILGSYTNTQKSIDCQIIQGPLSAKNVKYDLIGHIAWLTSKYYKDRNPNDFRLGIFADPLSWKHLKNIRIKNPETWLNSTFCINAVTVINEILLCEKVLTSSVTVAAICHSYKIPYALFNLEGESFEQKDYRGNDLCIKFLDINIDDIEKRQMTLAKKIPKSIKPIDEKHLIAMKDKLPFKDI